MQGTYLATVQDDVGSDSLGAKLLLVVTQEFDGLVVVERPLVVPSRRVYAGHREVLVGVLAEEAEEGHLNHADRFVRDLSKSKRRGGRYRQGAAILIIKGGVGGGVALPWKRLACWSTSPPFRSPSARECWASWRTAGPGRRTSHPGPSCCRRRRWRRPACPSWGRSSTSLE